MDELPARRLFRKLSAQTAHVHVDRAVTIAERPAPSLLCELGARDHRARLPRQCDQQTELMTGQEERRPADDCHLLRRPDLEWAGGEDFGDSSFHPVRRLTLFAG